MNLDEKYLEIAQETKQAMADARIDMAVNSIADTLLNLETIYGHEAVKSAIRKYINTGRG